MPRAKLVVLYPAPRDVDAFERVYTQEHAPMVTPQTFKGIVRFVATKVIGTPDGSSAPFHRIAELHFPSMEARRQRPPCPRRKRRSRTPYPSRAAARPFSSLRRKR